MIRAGDVVLVVLAACLIGAAFGLTWRPDEAAADYAIVRAPDQAPRSVPLDRRQRLEIPGRLGVSVVLIDAGRARFLRSPCAGQYCVHQAWLDAAGDFAACLPNGVSLSLAGRENHLDAIAY